MWVSTPLRVPHLVPKVIMSDPDAGLLSLPECTNLDKKRCLNNTVHYCVHPCIGLPQTLLYFVITKSKGTVCIVGKNQCYCNISRHKLENKRPMGHIAHLRKQFKSINTFDYIITLIKRREKNIHFMITYCFFIWILIQGCFVPKLVETGSVVLEKRFF